MSGLRHVRKSTTFAMPLLASLLLVACAPMPTVQHVMALPGTGKSLDQFDVDDATCRSWAERRIGSSPNQVATDATVGGAAVGTLLGAASGAAIGAAAGNPAMGAAGGAGVGLLGGTSVGVANAQQGAWSVQRRYDIAYVQCMYASGNQVP